jgi:hypothetical protein
MIVIKFTLSSQNPHHPHNIILTESTLSSQNSHYPHKIGHRNLPLTALISIRLLSFEWTCTGSSLRQVCPVSLLCGTPTKFMHFKRVRIVTKCANYICRVRFSVCPSDRMYQRGCHWTDFLEPDSGVFHNCLARNAKLSLKPDKNMGP